VKKIERIRALNFGNFLGIMTFYTLQDLVKNALNCLAVQTGDLQEIFQVDASQSTEVKEEVKEPTARLSQEVKEEVKEEIDELGEVKYTRQDYDLLTELMMLGGRHKLAIEKLNKSMKSMQNKMVKMVKMLDQLNDELKRQQLNDDCDDDSDDDYDYDVEEDNSACRIM